MGKIDKAREDLEAAAVKEAQRIAGELLPAIALAARAQAVGGIGAAAVQQLYDRIVVLRDQLAQHIAGSGFARDLVERVAIQATYGQGAVSAGGVTRITADFVAKPMREILDGVLDRAPLPSSVVERAAEAAQARIPGIADAIDEDAGSIVGGRAMDRIAHGESLDGLAEEVREEAPRMAENRTVTEQQSAGNEAKRDAASDLPDVVAMEYRTQMDDRVRPNHAALEGFRASVDSSAWETLTPPLGWGCRCELSPVMRSDVSADKLDADGSYIDDAVPPGGGPDEGWAGSLGVFGL